MKRKVLLLIWMVFINGIFSSHIMAGTLLDGLKAYYSMDIDMRDSTNTYNGSVGSSDGVVHQISGQKLGDGCYEFTGESNGFLLAHDNITDNANVAYTLSFWVYLDKLDYSGSYGAILEFDEDYLIEAHVGSGYNQLRLMQSSGYVWTMFYDQESEANKWIHYVQQYNGTHFNAYRNGILIGSSPIGPLSPYSKENVIGNNHSYNSQFDGKIDEVGYWDRALTPCEIKVLYNNGDGLAYPFDTESALAGSLVAWGNNNYGQTNVPEGKDFVAVTAGHGHGLALKCDGSLVAWGRNNYGQTTVPTGNDFVAISAGLYYNLALTSDGSIVGWGMDNNNQITDIPAGNDFVAIAAGDDHGLALKCDGSLVAWGTNIHGQITVPTGNDFVAIASGIAHSLALRSDGSIVGWGYNNHDQAIVPVGKDFTAIAAGYEHSLALKSDGSIVGWGYNEFDQADPPLGNDFIAIAAGGGHSLALKCDGSLIGWGLNSYGQTDPPPGNNFVAITAGGSHNLALAPEPEHLCMVLIPGGEFEMGDHFNDDYSEELPVHRVNVDSFYLSRYETTNQQYCNYLNSALLAGLIKVVGGIVYPSDDSSNAYPYCDMHSSHFDSQLEYSNGVFSVRLKDGIDMSGHPMVKVSWYGAVSYCNWISLQEGYEPCYNLSSWTCDLNKPGYRLPTEAEWEYAARGGEHAPYYRYPWGDSVDGSKANYWNSGDPYETGAWVWTTPIGYYNGNQTPAGTDMVNGYGLYDMAGNVWEWCNDRYSNTYYQECKDIGIVHNPQGPSSGVYRVKRGGCWGLHPDYCRVATRYSNHTADQRHNYTGLRIARSPEPVVPEVVLVPAGEFEMGDHHDGVAHALPVHDVYVDSFYISRFVITNEQYCYYLNTASSQDLIIVDNGIVYGADDSTKSYPYFDTHSDSLYSQIDYLNEVFSVRTKAGRDMSNDPVVEVTWYGSAAYCNWLSQQDGFAACYNLSTWECDFTKNGYRLPTEAEWEYAGRGGERNPYYRFPWGDTITHSQANYESRDIEPYDLNPTVGFHPDWDDGIWPYTSPVGSFLANGYGLYDMSGNVFQWCHDWYSGTYYQECYNNGIVSNPKGPSTGSRRILRGGAWSTYAYSCRVEDRERNLPGYGLYYGFRVVRNTGPESPFMPYPALKDCAPDIMVGTAVRVKDNERALLSDDGDVSYKEIIETQYNFITPENESKWGYLQENIGPEPYEFDDLDREDLDSLCNFANGIEGMHIKGHALVWHKQLPSGLLQLDDSQKKNHLEDHLEAMMSHYGGGDKIKYWDVVNEAYNSQGELRESCSGDNQSGTCPDGVDPDDGEVEWAAVYGDGDAYIHESFELARTVNEDEETILIYNDFNIIVDKSYLWFGEKKARAVKKLMSNLVKKNPALSGRIGVGFQCHFYLRKDGDSYVVNLNSSVSDTEAVDIDEIVSNLIKFSKLDDGKIKIFISELDVAIDPTLKDDIGAYIAQGDFYYDFVLSLAKVKNVKAIQTWGFTDKYYWSGREVIGGNGTWIHPLLWDAEFKAKPALWRFQEALKKIGGILEFRAMCPVELVINDPLGRSISKNLSDIPYATYTETDINDDGENDDVVLIPRPLSGDYLISVIPEIDAGPDETVTLEVVDRGNVVMLLDEVKISELPSEPLAVSVDRSLPEISVQANPQIIPCGTEEMVPITVTVDISGEEQGIEVELVAIDSSYLDDVEYVQGADLGTDDRELYLRSTIDPEGPSEKVYTIMYIASDAAGNVNFAETTVTVQDTTPPIFTTIPENITVECDGSGNTAELNAWLANVTASDVCGNVTISNDFTGLSDGCGATGSATVTWMATDECGNTTTTSATFTIVDTTPPNITCPPDVTLECPADTTPAETGQATATDVCGDVTITHSDVSVAGCGNTQVITRTWTATDECGNSSSCVQTIEVEDTTPPEVTVVIPPADSALQDGVTLTAEASDTCGDVAEVYFYIREPDGASGTPIGQEDLAANLNAISDKWEYSFDTTQLLDGYYVILAKAIDACGNEAWSQIVVEFSIRNWAVIELLPASEDNKAGRTMPVKFALRIAESVDPAMPFVYNEGLEIRIYDTANPDTILQTSVFGDGSTSYRIDSIGELYITNFKTPKEPAEYVVEIWRPGKNFLVGSFTFETVK